MAKKVFIGVGHGGIDPGAVGYVKEADLNLNMALACRDVLESYGVTVKMSRIKDENDDLNEEIRECNAFNPDLAVDIHNNAGGGDGFEVLHTIGGGVGKTLAKNIEAEVLKIGQNSRGLKTRKNSSGTDYYGFIRVTKCPAVICEGVFVDNATDVKIADTVTEQKKFGEAYAKGILKTLGIKTKVTTKSETKTETKAETKKETKPTLKVDCAKQFSRSIAGTYHTTDVLNLRCGAGTSKDIILQIPSGKPVKCYGYYTPVAGTKWFLVVYNETTGFVSSKYLR